MKRMLIVLFLIFCFASVCFAHSPRNVEIGYSQADKVLTVNFVHVTRNKGKHYIRKIVITRSNGKEEEFYYTRQDQTPDVSKDISIELIPKEEIKVAIYCKKGGVARASFIVPKKMEKEEEVGE